MENLTINIEDQTKTLEILQGDAVIQREPEKVVIDGLINAPFEYLTKREDTIVICKSHLIVDESKGIINLIIDESSYYFSRISGEIKINPDFTKFGINTGQARDTFELADFIKMNRFFFADKNTAMKLVSELKNFKAKVDREVEKTNDDRGNTRLLQNQIVESNIPEAFDLVVPLFKGQPEQNIRVEINIDSRSFECSLISPDAKDLINEMRAKLVREQVEKIKGLTPNLTILEV